MQNITIGLASDHAGYELKEYIKGMLKESGAEVADFGCFSAESVDYPDYAHQLANAIENGECKLGIAICGTGNGISMALNKHSGIRAALCWSSEIAALARQHNDANVLSMPGRFVSKETAKEITETFLSTEFEGGRHIRRIAKIPLVSQER